MKLPMIITSLCAGIVLTPADNVGAQVRFRPGSGPGLPSAGQAVNATHERLKTDADQAYQRGDYDRAIDLTSTVLRQNSRDAVAFYLRASARIEKGESTGDTKLVRDGIADARDAIRVSDNKNLDYYLPYLRGMSSLATLENREAHAEAAMKVADQVLKGQSVEPGQRANLLYQRSLAKVFLKDFEGAASDLNTAIRLVPSHFGAILGLADAYAAAGNKAQALVSFDRAIDAFPSNPLVYHNKGVYLQTEGDSEAAIVEFTHAVEIDSNYFWSYTNRGIALMSMGNSEAAEGDFTTSIKLNPQQPFAYAQRAASRLDQGKVDEAIADFSEVVKLDRQNPIAFADLGFAKFFKGDYVGALSEFDRAQSIDRSIHWLNSWRCASLVGMGRMDAAQRMFDDVLKRNVRQRDWIDNLVAYQLGAATDQQLMTAIAQSDKELQEIQRCEAYFFMGRRFATEGKTSESTASYRKVLDTQQRQLSAYRGAQFALNDFSTQVANQKNDQRSR